MTLKFALKAGCAAVAMAAGSASFASPFYVDVGTNYSNAGSKVTPTSTGVKNQFTFSYDSNTVILDSDSSGTISAGDALTTKLGLKVGSSGVGILDNNAITNFLPTASASSSNNGYGFPNWILTFTTTGLNGVVTGLGGPGGNVPQFAYSAGGVIDLLLSLDNGATFINFMDIIVTGGGSSGGGTVLLGKADFTNVDIGAYNNLFHSTTQSCNGLTGYYDIWSQCPNTAISFVSSQDTDVTLSQFTPGPVPNSFEVTTNHDGSGRFDIPEPGSLALFGLGLAALSFTQRRRMMGSK